MGDFRLNASSAARWFNCAASERVQREPGALVSEQTDSRREGIAASWVAEMVINGDASCANDLCGKTHEGTGWFVDQEMCDHVQGYLDIIPPHANAEVRAMIGPMVSRSDAAWYSATNDRLTIYDFKYGRRVIEANAPQLECGLAAMLDYGIPPELNEVVLGVYQPRAIHSDGVNRTVTITGKNDIMSVISRVRDKVARASDPNAVATPGSHCVGCLRAHDCTALTRTMYEMFPVIEMTGTSVGTPTQRAAELTFLRNAQDVLKARLAGVETEIVENIKAGTHVPGWALLSEHGKRAWTKPADTIKAMTGIDPMTKKLCTPLELERRGASKDAVKAMTAQPFIGQKLTAVTEKDIASMFEGNKT